MSIYNRPSRLFDPSPYIKHATGTLHIPTSLIHPSPSQISNLALHTSTTRTPDPHSLILAISGISKVSQAAYGIWFAKDSPFNVCSLLPEQVEQTGWCAELCGALKTLSILGEEAEGYNRFVILSESEYLVDGITRDIWTWVNTRPPFKDKKGYTLPNAEIWDGLHESILRLEYKGINVEFWKVESEETGFAAALAESTFPKKVVKLPGHVCYDYFVSKGAKLYEVKRMAKEMHLELPKKETTGNRANVKYPLRRLVLTGNDTDENMELFFGPKWNDAEKGIGGLWRQTRRSVLRSQLEKDGGKDKWFDNELSGFQWNIRPATEKEKRQVKEHIASRNKKKEKR